MNTDDFVYDLPESFIAQRPVTPRDASRLLVLDRRSGNIQHTVFRSLPRYLDRGDVVVLNETRVLPARLLGVKALTGGAVEMLLLRRVSATRWEALVRPGRRLPVGTDVDFGEGQLRARIEERLPSGSRVVAFAWDGGGPFEAVLDRLGELPLPPYIKEKAVDPDRYQTVFARNDGSKAAPTAGLHFTEELLEQIAADGIVIAKVTLHVGLGTFRPVAVDRIEDHEMHAEYFRIGDEAARAVNEAKARGSRVVAVGTTVVRALESSVVEGGRVKSGEGWTDLFITPGYAVTSIDALVTNFHLPRSTLLMLVSAFAGRDNVLRAYEEAKATGYRFFSFGDAMLVV